MSSFEAFWRGVWFFYYWSRPFIFEIEGKEAVGSTTRRYFQYNLIFLYWNIL